MNNAASPRFDIQDEQQWAPPAACLTIDFKFNCANCSQDLEGPVDLAGSEVTCPVCDQAFVVPAPPKPNETTRITLLPDPISTNGQSRYWIVDVRVLVINAPPQYVQLITEVPNSWPLPKDGRLPEEASEAVRKTVSAKFPRCPATPTRIQMADAVSLKRISGSSCHSYQHCRVWLLGKSAPTL